MAVLQAVSNKNRMEWNMNMIEYAVDVSSAFKFSATDTRPMYISVLIILITMVVIYML